MKGEKAVKNSLHLKIKNLTLSHLRLESNSNISIDNLPLTDVKISLSLDQLEVYDEEKLFSTNHNSQSLYILLWQHPSKKYNA